MSFLIDIQEKMQAGKGDGYARRAKVFNLKQMSKAMMFINEHGITSYEQLHEMTVSRIANQERLLESIKQDEDKLEEIAVLRTHVINYAKARETFAAYKASGYNPNYFEAHREILTLRRAAKDAFDVYKKEHGSDAQMPSAKELSAEYARILERKNQNDSDYRKLRDENREWLVADSIVRMIMEDSQMQEAQDHEKKRHKERS